MSQLYHIDSGLMIHQGLAEMVYRAWLDFDDTKHGVANSVYLFPSDWQTQTAIHQRLWFYIDGRDTFASRNGEEHHWIACARSLFLEARFEEIIEALEESGPFYRSCDKLKGKKCRKLIDKIYSDGHITDTERNTLFTVFPDR